MLHLVFIFFLAHDVFCFIVVVFDKGRYFDVFISVSLFHIVLHFYLFIYIYEVIHDICPVVYAHVKLRIYFVLLVFSTHAFMYLLSVTGIYRLNQS